MAFSGENRLYKALIDAPFQVGRMRSLWFILPWRKSGRQSVGVMSPNGFSMSFFQDNQDLIKGDWGRGVEEFFVRYLEPNYGGNFRVSYS